MAAGDQYRALAAKCDAYASQEGEQAARGEWESLANAYRRLAEQADRNALTDIVYETPPPEAGTRQPQQQQQQQRAVEPRDNEE